MEWGEVGGNQLAGVPVDLLGEASIIIGSLSWDEPAVNQ